MQQHLLYEMKVFFSRAMDGIEPEKIKAHEIKISSALSSLGMSISNPYKEEDERRICISGISEIVDNDLSILADSNIVLADLSMSGRSYVGALFELAYAYQHGKQIYVWVGDSGNEKRIWLKYHATAICKTFNEIFDILKMTFSSEGRNFISSEALAYYSAIAAKYKLKEEIPSLVKKDAKVIDVYLEEKKVFRKWVEKLKVEGTVVELGSGTGPWVPTWVKYASNVICVDISTEMLKISCRNNDFENVQHIKGDILNLNWLESFLRNVNNLGTIVLGFILNSFTFEQEKKFFALLSQIVSKEVRLVLLDCMSSPFTTLGHFSRTEIQLRTSSNSSRIFKLYKRNFLPKDACIALKSFGKIEDIFYTPNYFVAGVACSF